jgi:hypothetical protein
VVEHPSTTKTSKQQQKEKRERERENGLKLRYSFHLQDLMNTEVVIKNL